MTFCKECGTQLNEGAVFCGECGTSVQPNNEATSNVQATESKSSFSFQSFSKKQKMIGGTILAAIILLFIGYQAGASLTNQHKIVENFKSAVLSEDTSRVMSLLYTNDSRMTIDEASVDSLITYLNNNPSYYDFLMDQLESKADFYDQNHPDDFYYEDSSIFTLEQVGRTAFLFDRYRIQVMPFYFTLSTNYEDAIITLNGEELMVSFNEDFEQEFGPYMPGIYEVSASYTGDYSLLESSNELQLIDPSWNNTYVDLYLYGDYIVIDSDYEGFVDDSRIYINDEDIEFSLEDQYDEALGPISLDGSYEVHAELDFPWGTIVTDKQAIDHSYIYLSINRLLTDDIADDVVGTAFRFAKEYANARTNNDSSGLTTVSSSIKSDIENYFDEERKYSLKFLEASFNPHTAYLSYYDEMPIVNLPVQFVYEEEYEWFDEMMTDEKTESLELSLAYDSSDNNWIVVGYYYSYFDQNDETVHRDGSE
ncbi:zinc ribbon domain-containing protein [Halalkalibacter sp. APA_J-10(15)]|uniref:zinc ribbon domain-containing protein n=1 Tax=Halalkalibacter sp. APA_J-10(15) TaxID=2933805 RepID=UPI001FF56103|nr:zinc-ribbon domain-containing protein [Halalkalibacter sp. APA_J-10(15)]MCK0470234.1 zinc-ribbon domain-containing protein [Halalkalibacter sp. APA_J-10(15)]